MVFRKCTNGDYISDNFNFKITKNIHTDKFELYDMNTRYKIGEFEKLRNARMLAKKKQRDLYGPE